MRNVLILAALLALACGAQAQGTKLRLETQVQGVLPVANGGTGAAPASDDQVLVSGSASSATWRSMPNCPDSSGNHVNYTAATNTFSCGTSSAAATIASGTIALATAAISSGTCASEQTSSASGVLTSDVLQSSFSGDPTGVTGYVPAATGMLTIIGYTKSNAVAYRVCNNSASSITPGAITLNWRVAR